MEHSVHRVTDFQRVGHFTLRVAFEDGTTQVIDFRPVLAGEVLGPLRDPDVFDQLRLDSEAGTLVWPNGADFRSHHSARLARGRSSIGGFGPASGPPSPKGITMPEDLWP